jgi:hypothetical protein
MVAASMLLGRTGGPLRWRTFRPESRRGTSIMTVDLGFTSHLEEIIKGSTSGDKHARAHEHIVLEMMQNALTEKMTVADAADHAAGQIEDLLAGL